VKTCRRDDADEVATVVDAVNQTAVELGQLEAAAAG